jgi:hypothetical protein
VSLGSLAALEAIALAAFAMEGSLGFGGTLAAATLGAQVVPLRVLLPAFVPLDLAVSVYLVARGTRAVAWRVLAREVGPPAGAGAAVGLALGGLAGATWLPLAFGLLVVALAALELGRPAARPIARGPRGGMLALGGLVHGLFGTGGPLVVYVVRRRLVEPGVFRATLGVLWLVLDAALIARFAAGGRYDRDAIELLGVLALALAPGLYAGERLHAALDPRRFTRAAWLVLLAAGGALAVRASLAW